MSFYLVTSFIFMAVMVVGFTAYFFVVEDFGGVLETFYFVIVTVRTIGFGDYSPQTNAGRIGTILLALLPATVFLGASLVVLETAMKSLEQIWRKWMLGKNNNHTIVIAHTDLLASIVHELDATNRSITGAVHLLDTRRRAASMQFSEAACTAFRP